MNSGSEHGVLKDSDWAQWLARHGPALLLFARQQTTCEADAQDLVQEAVVESWKNQHQGAPPPVGYVYATIRHRAIDLARREGRRAVREFVAEKERPQYWFDSGVVDQERNLLLQKAMNDLPVIFREVVTLKVWSGLTFDEIAETLQIPANTAASRYRYGLIELRKLTKEVFA